MNPLLIESQIESFLADIPAQSRRRGKNYYERGAVLEVACVEQDHLYSAVVRGSEDYQVGFEYDPREESWFADCSCPLACDCKHIYAAMLALKANAFKLTSSTPAYSKPGRAGKKKAKLASIVLKPEPQPPLSPLASALTLAVGRDLNRIETAYVQQLQRLFQQAHHNPLTNYSISQLANVGYDYTYQALDIWPAFPRNDLEFWLYCAWEIRRRGVALPQFMEPVTDFSSIEPAMRNLDRRKAIASWQETLAGSAVKSRSEAEPVDFRLMILPREARIQWKTPAEPAFKDLKQAHQRRFNQEHESGTMAVEPDAYPLWISLYHPYNYYDSTNLTYDKGQTIKVLNRVLRLPALASRMVKADGTPLARPDTVLGYRLDPAQAESEDYRIGLVAAEGSTLANILVALPGKPALYLTEHAVYAGPTPHGFPPAEPLHIPAPALECADGISFLQQLNLELPPRILARTKRVNSRVKLECSVKSNYIGSETQSVFIKVTAETEGGPTEVCLSGGWQIADANEVRGKKKKTGDNLIPIVDRSVQVRFPALLDNLGAKWEYYNSSWRVRLTKKFPDLFGPWLASLPPEVEVLLDPDLATLRDAPVTGSLSLDIEEAGVDWFDLKVALKVSDTNLTPEELRLLLNAKGGFVRLGAKGWRRLQIDLTPEDDERLARLGLNARDFSSEPQRLHALQLADDAARKFLPEVQAEQIQRRASEIKMRVTPPVPAEISAQLRPYQVTGFHFLAYLTANSFGGVLADDMGLGKTLQTLTWLIWLRNGGLAAGTAEAQRAASLPPSLVVCPKSVMDNWRAEAQRFCTGLRVRIWQGENAAALDSARAENDLLVLNYSQLRSLSPDISRHQWHVSILDEAQYIKNPDSQTAQIARSLKAAHRLALTGTPIENRLLDLWSIFAYAMPGVLGNRAAFLRLYNQQDDPFARRRLAARVRPFLIRRAKSQVARDLPDRIEEDILCEMEGEQKTLYRAEFKRAQQMLLSLRTQKELNEQRFNFLSSLLRLRQICCHPALVSRDLRAADAAKVNALLDLLEPLVAEGHKVLVFSQFVTMLDILRETIQEREWPHFYLAGDTENRGELVAEFQAAKGSAVFLISLKAGGFGLNLTAASYVILFDPWWNPAVEAQAIDRTHRIGQTSKVIAYRLLMKDSIEQKIRVLQRTKAALAQDVLGEEQFAQSLTLDDLRTLFAD